MSRSSKQFSKSNNNKDILIKPDKEEHKQKIKIPRDNLKEELVTKMGMQEIQFNWIKTIPKPAKQGLKDYYEVS